MNGKVDNIVVTILNITTWGPAVEMSMSAMNAKSKPMLLLFHPKPCEVEDELRKLAREYCAAHDGWNVTGHCFVPSTSPLVTGYLGAYKL